jgi:hypothetical protein
MDPAMARYLWQLIEPYHAVIYFAPNSIETYEAAGLKGGWMGYFAGRSAAMGAIAPGVVTATFFNFHPRMVERAIPDAWSLSTPHAVLTARLAIADAELRRLLGDTVSSPDISDAAEIAVRAARSGDGAGRPLFAANVALPLPGEPHLDLWAACTALREHRGDGHVACLVDAALDGCEANVIAAAAGFVKAHTQMKFRGWSEDEWAAAHDRLEARGLVDADGLTDQGRALKADIEDTTDRLAAEPYEALTDDELNRFVAVMEDLAARIIDAGAIRYPNPMGLTPPKAPA